MKVVLKCGDFYCVELIENYLYYSGNGKGCKGFCPHYYSAANHNPFYEDVYYQNLPIPDNILEEINQELHNDEKYNKTIYEPRIKKYLESTKEK